MDVENTKRRPNGIEHSSLNEQVLNSELRYRRLFEAARDGIFLLDIDTLRITDANPFMTELLGYTLEEFLGRELWELGFFSDKEASKEAFRVLQKDGYLRYDDLPLKTKDGQSREVEFVSNVYSEGDVEVIQCNIRDITERKHLKSEQEAIEGRFQTLFEYAPDGILIANPESYYLEANASMCRMLGYTRDELIGLHAEDIVIPSEIVHIEDALAEIRSAADHHRVWKFRRKDGSEFSGEVLLTEMPDGNLLAMIRDNTDRKKADDEKAFLISKLESERKRLDNIVVSIPGVVWETARVRETVSDVRDFVSGHVLQMFDYTVEEWIATPDLWLEIVHPDDRERVGKFAEAASIVGQDVTDEYRCLTKDGRVIWVETRSTPIIDENGKAVGLRGVTIDITERRRAEEELRDNEERFSAAFEFAPIGVALVLPDGRWLKVNRAVCELTGYSEEELLESTFQHITHPDDLADDMDHVRRLLAGEIPYYQIEKRYIHKLGHTVSVLLNVSLVRDDMGDPRYFISQIQDITERKRAENNLRESESLLAASQRISHAGSWVLNFEGDGKKSHERWSDEHYRIYGFEPDEVEITDELFYNSVHPDDRERLAKTIREAIAERRSFDIEHRILLPDGRERVVHAMAALVLDEETGKPKKLLGSAQDITERKRSEEDLQRGQAELRVLFDLMPAMIWFKDTKNNVLRVNRRAADAAGLSIGEIEGRPAHEIYPEVAEKSYADDLEVLRERTAKLGSVEMISTADGRQLWVQTDRVPYYDPEGEPIGIVVMAQDVTERKRIEDALVESDEKFHQLADNINDVFWIRSPDMSRVYYISPGFAEIWGRPVDMVGIVTTWTDHIFPDDRQMVTDAYAGLMDDVPQIEVEYRIVRPNGEHRWVRSRGFQVRNSEGMLIRLAGIVTDITDRKFAEAALAAAEENYRSIFENAVEGIFQSTEDGRFISANPAMARILGYDSPEQLLADRVDVNTQHYVDPACRSQLKEILASDGVAKGYECEVYRRDRSRIWTQENIRTVRNANGELFHYEGSLEDITERKSLEGQLRQSQKMEAVGVLAGGIAHDFNNLLTAINGYSSLTLKKMSTDDRCRNYIVEVKNAGDRAAELTSQLLAFSRKQVLQPVVINLNTVVSSFERMLRRIIKESVELRVVLDEQLGNVRADPGQIEQVIMNLAINARDAMPDGGTLTVETKHVTLDEHFVSQHATMTAGEFIRMTVADTGEGMGAETRSHIFEPFFTTKEPGKGTGLGLSTVYGIVKQSGGDISVYSELGHGTTFKIYLPCVTDGIQEPKWTDRVVPGAGSETILLVEDEDIVRTFVKTILVGDGYEVLEASNGADALEIARSFDEPIHLLLTDLIMPKMSGTELKEKIQKIRPDIKNLFMSGYTDDSISHHGVLISGTAFIEKPFSPDSLFRKIREVLES